MSLNFGEQRNLYIGNTVTGIPDDSCKFSYGNCRKLNETFSQISLYPRNAGGIIYTNTFNGNEWSGWRKGISDSDFMPIINITDTHVRNLPFKYKTGFIMGSYPVSALNKPENAGGFIIAWKYSDGNVQARAFSNTGAIFKCDYVYPEWDMVN